jgi:hypothetical protein
MKRVKTHSATPLSREVRVWELGRIRGGTVVVSDPGPGDGKGPKVTGGTEAGVVVIGGDGPGGIGPN